MGRCVIGPRLGDRQPDLGRKVEPEQVLVVAAHDQQVRTAIHDHPTVIRRVALRASIRGQQAGHTYLADAVGRDIPEVLLEHHPAAL